MNAVEVAEHRLLVCMFIDAHRPERRYMSREVFRSEYHTDLDTRLFNSIITDLRTRELVKATPTLGSWAVRLHHTAYGAALTVILRNIEADTFEVDWGTKRIVTDSPVQNKDELFPCANGWMLLTVQKKGVVTPAPVAPVQAPVPAVSSSEGPWTKIGVIVAVLSLIAAVVGIIVTIGG